MTSIFKEYGFVIISMIGAVVFFFLLGYMLKYENQASIVRMMDSNMQYSTTKDTLKEYQNGGNGLSDWDQFNEHETSGVLTATDNWAPRINIADNKQFKLQYVKTKTVEGLDGNDIKIEPDYWVLTTEEILKGVTTKNCRVSDISLVVTDYTLALTQTDASTETSLWGRLTDSEEVIAVDKFGNKKVNEDGTYEMTERTAYTQRNNVDSKELGADEYTGNYGQVYFYHPYDAATNRYYAGWYKDTDGDGEFNKDVDENIDNEYKKYADLPSSVQKSGIVFSTTVPHKFKVLYRVTGQDIVWSDYGYGMTKAADTTAIKTEVTKLFVSPTRSQVQRSIEVWTEAYGEGTTETEVENTAPVETQMLRSSLEDYEGLTGSQVIDEAVANKLAAVQEWQEEERERAEEEARAEQEAKEQEEKEKKEKADKKDKEITDDTEESEDTEDTETTEE